MHVSDIDVHDGYCILQDSAKVQHNEYKRKMESYLLCLQVLFLGPPFFYQNTERSEIIELLTKSSNHDRLPNFYQFKLEFGFSVFVRWCIQLIGLCLITTKNFCLISSTAKLPVLGSTVCVFLYSTVLGDSSKISNATYKRLLPHCSICLQNSVTQQYWVGTRNMVPWIIPGLYTTLLLKQNTNVTAKGFWRLKCP